MSQAQFDTHAAVRKLERAGCPVPQAEAMVSMVMQATGIHLKLAKDLEKLRLYVETSAASKQDLDDLRVANKTDIDELRAETKRDFADLRAEMQARFVSIGERFDGIEERMAHMGDAIATLAERHQHTVTKDELFRAIWVQGAVLASLILTLSVSMVTFIAFTLNTA